MNDSESRRIWVLEVLEQFEGRLVRYATRLLNDEHAARDAVQHTFLQLCHASPKEIGDRVAAWLFTVCRHRVLDSLRLNNRESALEAAGSEEDQSYSGRAKLHDDPSNIVERQELHERIRQAVDSLPVHQREALLLYSEGFSYREIAAITGRKEGAVRVVVHRAVTRLRVHPDLHSFFETEVARAATAQPSTLR